jgi:hypothetical protein
MKPSTKHSGVSARRLAFNGTRQSPYDRAMALCPNDSARLELSRLGADLNLGASSPEWIMVVLYAEARGIFGATTETERTGVLAQLERIERAQKMMVAKRAEPIVNTYTRDLIAFAIAILAFLAVAVLTGVSPAPAYALIAAFALGLCIALAYIWFAAPLAARRK